LSIITTNEYDGSSLGRFNDSEIDVRKSLLVTSIKGNYILLLDISRSFFVNEGGEDVVRMFGIEIILLWTALLMKKRVAVFSEKLSILLRVIRYMIPISPL